MDKQEKIRLIMEKVYQIEFEKFCMGLYANDIDISDYERHEKFNKGYICSLYELLEDLL